MVRTQVPLAIISIHQIIRLGIGTLPLFICRAPGPNWAVRVSGPQGDFHDEQWEPRMQLEAQNQLFMEMLRNARNAMQTP